jgi:HNH endonuclease
VVDFVMELEKRKKLNEFIEIREKFENLLLNNDYLIKQIYEKYRDVQKSYKIVSYFFQEVIAHLRNGKSEHDTVKEIASTDKFKYLNVRELTMQIDSQIKDFDKNQKSEIFLNEALQNPPKCRICNGLIHKNSISIDHIQRKADGGCATVENGQITHPYCNTTYKN